MGVPGFAGFAGLFTLINMVLKERPRWIKVLEDVREALSDFCLLLNTAAAKLTNVKELVPGALAYMDTATHATCEHAEYDCQAKST